ncbi:MAG: prolipoprotein diacylglyceryl transferase [Phycisphaerales bacterium]|nr:prolipoprotein diacylglyceryl transferase [Phycisphaerae bacterium]NNF43726.1 prolipoprotein diacylglyceryl transferase [Phycisphaerales bacterium]NNM25293.1 prolipoprotein diacylglyceryl transferase [Phycisphaerales bacterium]
MPSLLAESYLHRLDPVAIPITDSFGLRWYGLSYAFGFLAAWLVIRWMARSRRSPLTVEAAGDFIFYIIAGVLVGGRVGYAIFYDPALFVSFDTKLPFWGLLAINEGGMASHGGILGVIAACVIFARRRGLDSFHLLDLVAFTCPIGLGAGRVANFVNGELWGEPLPATQQADPPGWSVKYPEQVVLDPDLAVPPAVETELQTIVGGLDTFRPNVVAALRDGDERVTALVQPLLTAHYPSQLIQAIAEGPLLLGILCLLWLRPRRPGMVGVAFLGAYGVLRIVTELFRQPDVGVDRFVGLSRGQVLSLLMVAAAIVCFVWMWKRNRPRIGGLLPTPSSPS